MTKLAPLDTFPAQRLLDAVSHLDDARRPLADGPHGEPPAIRNELLRLQRLARDARDSGSRRREREVLQLASELREKVLSIIVNLEEVDGLLLQLLELSTPASNRGDSTKTPARDRFTSSMTPGAVTT